MDEGMGNVRRRQVRPQFSEADPCTGCKRTDGEMRNVQEKLCSSCANDLFRFIQDGGTIQGWRKRREQHAGEKAARRTEVMTKEQDKILGLYHKLIHILNQLHCTEEHKRGVVAVIELHELKLVRYEIPEKYRSITNEQWKLILGEKVGVTADADAADGGAGEGQEEEEDGEGEEADDSVEIPEDAVAPPELPEEESKPEAAEKTQAPQPPKLPDAVKKKDVVPPAPFIPETPPHPEPELAKVSPEAAAAIQQAAESEPDSEDSELREILGKPLEPREVEDAIAATRGLKREERKQKLVELLEKRKQEENEKYNTEVRRLEAEMKERIKSLAEAEIEQAKSQAGKPRQPTPKAYGPYTERVVNAFASRPEVWQYTGDVAVVSGVSVGTLRRYLNEFHIAGLLERHVGQWGKWKLVPNYMDHPIYQMFFPKE